MLQQKKKGLSSLLNQSRRRRPPTLQLQQTAGEHLPILIYNRLSGYSDIGKKKALDPDRKTQQSAPEQGVY